MGEVCGSFAAGEGGAGMLSMVCCWQSCRAVVHASIMTHGEMSCRAREKACDCLSPLLLRCDASVQRLLANKDTYRPRVLR